MSATAEPRPIASQRARLHVTGTVQGVGFRPHAHRLASELALAGYVRNDSRGVEIEIEGPGTAIAEFTRRLRDDAPPLAVIESIESRPAAPTGDDGFRIVTSDTAGTADAAVAPDTATCEDCLAELFDPTDRRHRYPFINCTNCGPRLTIVRGVPYDRALTTMASFEMCERCRAEFDDPDDRRFHAQPNACPDCGPRARLLDAAGRKVATVLDPVEAAAARLLEGDVVAVKGLGGYHLACLAADEGAVAALRARKHRDQKPLALMVAGLADARELVELTAAEEGLLSSARRPILIARRRAGACVADGVAPRSADLGVMLAYTPLHHLLLRAVGAPLVMTSGNLSDEPIAYSDDEALSRLAGIADAFLVHDRPIETRVDDSVLRAVDPAVREQPLLLRRSRGWAPDSISLPAPTSVPTLGCGAELKSTFCLARGERAWVSHHIGDLRNFETLRSYEDGIDHFRRLFAVEPRRVAHDRHPDYLATRYALEREGVEAVAVQHHHAHLAATLAEHGREDAAVGAILDGAGYGGDGTVWGGEILAGDLRGFERAGHLRQVPLPGGDAAAREPWRMALAWLAAVDPEAAADPPAALAEHVGAAEWRALGEVARSGLHSPLTSSAGRLFDAVAAICGVRARAGHEGQAATELEGLADPAVGDGYAFSVEVGPPILLDPVPALAQMQRELARGGAISVASARFHNGLATAVARACAIEAERRGLSTVVLAGGVFQNRLLAERTVGELRAAGLEVLFPRLLPPNDGQISYGQVAVAAAGDA